MSVSTKQQRIAELEKQARQMSFVSLNHYVDQEWLKEAHKRIKKSSSPGVDEVTAQAYGEDLEENVKSLLERAKSGSYDAPPVKRVYIPKGKGKEKRPIGVPCTENKVLERAITMLLEPIYEQDFLESSYGFRPGRSAHQALERIWKATMEVGGGWVLDVDVQKFFDKLSHKHLRELIEQRVQDGVVRRLIDKWLKAGVLEEGRLHYPREGSPQGSVISPLLSNIYLHYVLDEWIEREIKPRLKGKVELIRYADDCVPRRRERRNMREVA